MTNVTIQLDDAVRNSVAAARVLVDLIHKPSLGAPFPPPGIAQYKVATAGRGGGGQDNGVNGGRGEGDVVTVGGGNGSAA